MTTSYASRASIFVAAVSLALCAPALADDPTHDAFTYQGQLRENGEPVTDAVNLKFRLFNALEGGDQVGDELLAPGYDSFDDQGRFTIDLEFGKANFDGMALWLEIEVNGSTLSPRQPIMPAPYAVRALSVSTVDNDSLAGSYSNQIDLKNPANQISGVFNGNGAGITNLNANNLTTGTLGSSLLSGSYTNAMNLNNAANTFTGSFAGSGSGLTSLNASNISSGNLSPTRLPSGGNWSLSSTLNIGSNQFVINPTNSRIGVGTATPAAKLHVVNWTVGDTYTLVGQHGADGIGVQGSSASGIGVSAFSSGGTALYATSNSGIGVRSDVTSSTVGGTGFWSEVWGPGGRCVDVFSYGSGTTYGVRAGVNSSSGYGAYFYGPEGSRNYFERSVGIGTASPQLRLSIVYSGTGMDSPAFNTLGLYTNATERLRVTSAGNVGIGTTSPQLRLSIADSGTGIDRPVINTLGMYTNGTERMRITSAGDVGIGTSSPDARLHLQDAGAVVGIKLRAGASWTAEIQQTNSSYFNFSNGGQVRMTIRAGGQVGIGTEEPGSFLLAVNGSAAKPGGGSWSAFSDARLKHNIQPLEPGTLDQLLALRGYTFEYEDHAIENRLALPGKQVGLIAQEVQSVFPDWVDADDEGYLYITERGLTAILVEALRELREEKDVEIDALRAHNEELEQRLARLEAILLNQTNSKIRGTR